MTATYSLVIRPQAEEEISEARLWYEDQRVGLGSELMDSLELTLARIRSNPKLFPVVRGKLRRALLSRFPYALLFLIQSDRIQIVAFFHGKRDPRHFQSRS